MLLPLLITLLSCGQPADSGASTPLDGGADAGGADAGGADAGAGDTGGAAAPPDLVDAETLLSRASLDLRGRRPSLDELAAVAADPGAVDDLVAVMLDDPALPERMAWLYDDAMHTALWMADFDRFDGELQRPLSFSEWRSMGWEPLAMVAAIVDEDRPFSDLVLAEELPTDADLASLYGTAGAPDSGWGWGSYQDERPMAGVLSSTSLWLRYNADLVNHNRRRANALSSILLCSDFFDRDGTASFQVEGEVTDIEHAVETEPSCTSCHAALDPLASFFGGFPEKSSNLPMAQFFGWSAFSDRWTRAGLAPAYYGVPASSLSELGALIAADRRFARCAVTRFYEGLTDQALAHDEAAAALVDDFVDGGMRVRPLLAEVIASDAYRQAPLRVLRPEQLASALQDLTGWAPGTDLDDGLTPLSWSQEHRILAGGTDDVTVLSDNGALTTANQVLQEWVGRQAAGPAVDADLALPLAERRIVTVESSAGEAEVRQALADLAGRALGRVHDPEGAEVDLLFSLWLDGGGWDDWAAAWSLVLEGLIRHPDMAVH